MGKNGLRQICAVKEIRRINIGVHSGAAASIWSRDCCKDYYTKKTEKTGTKDALASKDSKHLVNQGERFLHLKMQDGTVLGARMQVTNVWKPLMSVADMNDAGKDVCFLASCQSYAVHRETGRVTKFITSKGVFEIDAEVPPYRLGPQRHSVKSKTEQT